MPRIYSSIQLPDDEVQQLRHQVRTGIWLARDLVRARILLVSHDQPELAETAVAKQLGCSSSKVHRTKVRYRHEGLTAALHDKPRPGQPKRLTPEHEAFVVATACTEVPAGYDHWSLTLLNRALVSQYPAATASDPTIGKVLLRNNLKPWLKKNVVHPETGRPVHRTNA